MTAATDIIISNSLADLAARIKAEHEATAAALKSGVEHAMAAGDLLVEARAQLKHGQWLPWLNTCGISERMAQRYMRLARNRGAIEAKSDTVSDLGIKGALAMLTVPRGPQGSDDLSHMVMGLADHVADTAFDFSEIEEMEERQRIREARAPLFAEILAAMDKIHRLHKLNPALPLWNDEEEGKLIEAATEEYRDATAAEMGVSRDDYDQMGAEMDALKEAGVSKKDIPYLVYQKFEHAMGESGPSQPRTAALLKMRDITTAFLQRAEAAP
jgi:hypothetical protein